MLVLADADDQRAAKPSGEEHIRIITEQDRQALSALKLGECRLDRADQMIVLWRAPCRFAGVAVSTSGRRLVAILFFQAARDQMGDDFAIGRRAEDIAFAFQALLERA